MMQQFLTALLLLGFLVGIHNGYVAVWKDEDPQPIYVSPISADTLPEKDRQALEQGLHFPTYQALTQAIEDYCS